MPLRLPAGSWGTAGGKAVPKRLPPQTQEVGAPKDLPTPVLAPDNVMRVPLRSGFKYEVIGDFVLPRIWWPVFDPLNPGAVTEIVAGRKGIVLEIDGDDTPHFWGRSTGGILISAVLLDIGNAGAGRSTRFFDLVASTEGASFTFLHSEVIRPGAFGTIWDYSTELSDLLIESQVAGVSFRSNPASTAPISLRDVRFIQKGGDPSMVKPMIAVSGSPNLFGCYSGNHRPNASDTVLAIAEDSAGAYDVIGNSVQSSATAQFLTKLAADTITEMAPVDIAVTSVEDSLVAPGVDSALVVGVYTGLRRGQSILLAGLGAPYDGMKTIKRVGPTERKIEIASVFAGTASGSIKITRFTTSVPNDISESEPVEVASVSYNLTEPALFVTSTTFDLPVAFVIDDGAGTADIARRDEKSIGVNLKSNSDVKDSKSIGGCVSMGNAAITTLVTQPLWTDLVFAAGGLTVATTDIERWEVANAVTGELRLLGERFDGVGCAKISAVSSGSAQRFQFRIVKNGSPMPDGAVSTDGLTGTSDQLAIEAPIVGAVTGDLYRVQVQNIDGSSSLIVQEMVFTTR